MSTPEVVIVEDDSAMRAALVRLLTTAGFHARTFASAEDVLSADPGVEPTCFVIDIRLPGLSGIELHSRLTKAGSRAPAIFMTAHDEPALRRKAEEQGAAAFLLKPFVGRKLIEEIRHAAGQLT